MSKYSFDRITPDDFESMAQALLEQTYRIEGNLIQFGPGADAAREATWTQPVTHSVYSRPSNQNTDVPKEWVFQVKYHDIGLRGWSTARDVVVNELDNELSKVINKYKVPCHAYVMITNVPFTGVRDLGTRDRISAVAKKWKDIVPEIFVWDASDLSRMLDANESVRTAYLDTILPGDLIKAICKGISFREDRTRSALRAYLLYVTDREGIARAEEAGDEPGLPLADVFIDLTMKPCQEPYWETESNRTETNLEDNDSQESVLPEDYSLTPASFSLLIADHDRTLLLGGPGLGKSTLTQFVALYHASRLVNPSLARRLACLLKLPAALSPEKLDAHCRLRIPFRIELRRYARWMSEEQINGRSGEMARYVAEVLINPNVSSSLNMDDIFAVVATDPILLILDGLDEVPHSESRQQIQENLQVFLRRTQAENADIKLLFSSRPKGYSGEFTVFEPFTWEINDLDHNDFNDYCNRWLDRRIRDAAEKSEALERIDRGMKSEAVRLLAQSLLQATVMLTIVRRKNEIPHQRHALYAKYVEVIFDREKEKSQVVRDHEAVLSRLHERVGYELHCKMEQTSVEALDSNSFRGFVLNVLEDYSGTNLGQKKIREVADEIIIAATDRLCLLIGKGNEQTEIDFVVQSYREYFAAVYLFNHPDAVPDLVFSALVCRGGYWANVLQFYVAQASSNQQMRWVMNADGSNSNTVDEIVKLTRTRRALINVLPEFKQQRNNDFDRALQTIFSLSTRWTWLEQKTLFSTLRILRHGYACLSLKELFKDLTVTDAGALAVELRMLVRLSSSEPRKQEKTNAALIQALFEVKEARTVALATAIENKIAVDTSCCDVVDFSKPGVVKDDLGGKTQSIFFSQQNVTTQIELLLAGFKPKTIQTPPSLATRIKDNLSSTSHISLFNNAVTLKLSPYLCRSSKNISVLTEIREELSDSGNPSVAYFDGLVHAAMDPTNLELDLQARAMERSIEEVIGILWDTNNILGPPVTAFSSEEKWVTFKHYISVNCTDDPAWLSNSVELLDLDSSWIALLFHPDDWPLLVAEKLLRMEDQEALTHSCFGRLLSQPLYSICIEGYWTATSEAKHSVPLGTLLRTALQIAESRGINRIGEGGILSPVLCYAKVEPTVKKEADLLLSRALDLPSLPSAWFAAVLRLCLVTPDIDFELLVRFWKHSNVTSYLHLSIPGEVLPETCNVIVSKLLDLGEEPALQFAMTIMASGRTSLENVKIFLNRIECAPLVQGDTENYALTRSILCQVPTLEEFKHWEKWNDTISKAVGRNPWLFRRIIQRFHEAIQTRNQLDGIELRKRFSPFILQRCDYPWEVSCAALEAVITLDERGVPPLEEADWQLDT